MRERLRAAGIGVAVVCGAGVAIQSKVNGSLADRLHDGLAAAVVSFWSGLAIVAVVSVAWPASRRAVALTIAALRDRSLPWWQCLGGICGAALVASQGLTVAALGVAIFTVAAVAGQAFASLAVDRAGLGPGRPQPLTGPRVAGATLTVGAVVVAVADQFGSPKTIVYALLPLVAGASTSWQQAVNGRVRAVAGRVEAATLVNFIAGAVALAIAFGIDVALRGAPTGALPTAPWYYVGGVIGVAFIALAAGVVRHTGVLLLGLGMVAGQLVTAVIIDAIAPTAHGRPTAITLAGVGLMLVAVLVAAAPSNWLRQRQWWNRRRDRRHDRDLAEADR